MKDKFVFREIFVFNNWGVLEVLEGDLKDKVLEGVKESDWEEVEGFKSDIVKKYSEFDGIGRVVVSSNDSIEEVLREVERIDECLFY